MLAAPLLQDGSTSAVDVAEDVAPKASASAEGEQPLPTSWRASRTCTSGLLVRVQHQLSSQGSCASLQRLVAACRSPIRPAGSKAALSGTWLRLPTAAGKDVAARGPHTGLQAAENAILSKTRSAAAHVVRCMGMQQAHRQEDC